MILRVECAFRIHEVPLEGLPALVDSLRLEHPGEVIDVWSPRLVADLDLEALADLDRRRRPRLSLVK
jgi:hypothetical protein